MRHSEGLSPAYPHFHPYLWR
ncbi:hypothetical protein SEA_YUMA_114 [Microbacterium phage Yuma]|nr:hypothetical protein SEA_YUMA_114 [Microbacterium phage Yuma]